MRPQASAAQGMVTKEYGDKRTPDMMVYSSGHQADKLPCAIGAGEPLFGCCGLAKDSGADAFQTKSVSQNRLVRILGRITDQNE